MPKKNSAQPMLLRPSNCIKSLDEFNMRVLALVQTVGLLLEHPEAQTKLKADLQKQHAAVKEFYELEN